ncbi:MAG: outer membrane beta-barrel protein [Paludibacter sp.]
MQIKRIDKYLLILALILMVGSSISAQGNLPYVDDKRFHFGFSLGLGAFDFGVTPSMVSTDGKIYKVETSSLKPAFSVGIISNLRLNKYLNLRFTPTLQFGDRTLNYYSESDKSILSTDISSIPICLPIYLKYSAERKKNYRPYVLWGGGGYLDLGRNKDKPVLLNTLDFYTEFGVGCDLYFSFFKLAPELKFAVGFNDMLTPISERTTGKTEDNKLYSTPLSKLTSRMLTLSFNFE